MHFLDLASNDKHLDSRCRRATASRDEALRPVLATVAPQQAGRDSSGRGDCGDALQEPSTILLHGSSSFEHGEDDSAPIIVDPRPCSVKQ
jgi:hypothetical protein